MVDNFALIEQYMAKQALTWKEGDCYYVQLLRRQADDPMIGGVKDKKYHGNMHSRSIKDYLIKSVDHLEDVKQQIIEFCKLENVRAYIRLNKRNYKNIALEMMKHIAEQTASGESYSSPFHLVSSACGETCQAGKDKTWIVDLDKEYLPYENDVKEMILDCQPYDKRIQAYRELGLSEEEARNEVKKEFFVVPTKSGKHIVCKPFNKDAFSHMPKADEIAIAKEKGTEPRYGLWEQFCKSRNIELKCPDIHKDNPVILYVPDCAYHQL